MKKIITFTLIAVMLLSLTACSSKTPGTNGDADVTTPLWSLKYDKSVWTLNEEDMETEDGNIVRICVCCECPYDCKEKEGAE